MSFGTHEGARDGTSDLEHADVVYELRYLRRKRLEFKGLVKLAVRAYDRLVKGSAVRQSVLSLQQN